jgi:hypothetical protein
MTHPDRTAIALVVDRSGSMGLIEKEAQGALDEFVKAQEAQPGEVYWTVVLFNKTVERPYINQTADAPLRIQLLPSGMTALNDAVGTTVADLGKALAAMDEDERPSKVIVAILTDGQENSSVEYTSTQVREIVKRQTDEWQWEFVFLATGMDQFTAERIFVNIGGLAGNAINVDRADHRYGTQVVNSYAASSRAGGQSVNLQEVKAKMDEERKTNK